jgi:hypothetical protein
MVHADFRVEMIGHATLRVQSGGRTLLTDPWLIDPMVCGTGFHFPPLVHDPAAVAAETDAIYVSHVHPDHLHHPSLALFRRDTPVYIGAYRRKEFRDELHRLGFAVVEAPFGETVAVAGTSFSICVLEHDFDETAAYDSAIVIRTPEFALFENNDCFLRPEKYAWVRERFAADYAFLGYSPASFFPIAFEMPAAEKAALLADAGERRYAEFVEAAALLRPALTVPFASGLRFLEPTAQWKNVLFNSAAEAVRRARARGLAAETMGPGDRIAADGTVEHVAPVLAPADESGAIAAYAAAVRAGAAAADAAPAPADLVDRLRDHILGLWRETEARLPGVREYVIAYVLRGPPEQRFHFDFSRPLAGVFQWGDPPRYDMRYTYPSRALQHCLDGRIDWDELHFSFDVSVHQVRYARDFYRMLRSALLDLG